MILSWKERADVYCNYGSDVALTDEANKPNTNNSSALTDPLRNTSTPSGRAGGSTPPSPGPGKCGHLLAVVAGLSHCSCVSLHVRTVYSWMLVCHKVSV